MPIQVEGPDGQLLEFPDDTPRETMRAAMQKRYPPTFSGVSASVDSTGASPEGLLAGSFSGYSPEQMAADNAARQAQYDPQAQAAAELSARQSAFRSAPAAARFAAGAGQRVESLARGVHQLGSLAADRLAPRAQNLSGLVSGLDNSRYAEALAAEQVARQSDRFMEDDTAAAVGGVAGDVAMLAAPGSQIAKLSGMGARTAANTALGATVGAVAPIVDGESRALNAGIGGAFGGTGELLGTGVRAIGSKISNAISPELRALASAAKDRGIKLLPSQLSDSKALKFFDSSMRQMPFSGAGAKAADQRQAWNKALAGTIGEDADAVTPNVYANAKERIGGAFNALSERNKLPVSDDLLNRLGEIQAEVAGMGDEASVKAVNTAINRMLEKTKDGVLPGRAYQSFDSNLGMSMKAGGEKAHYLGQIRDAVRKAMDEAISPEDQAAWALARQQYKNLKTIAPIVSGDGGNVSPAALLGRVRATRGGKEAFAEGRAGEQGLLGQIGQRLKEAPSSGTAEREAAGEIWNPMQWPKLAVGSLLGPTMGRLPNSGLLANAMLSPVPGATISQAGRLLPIAAIGVTPAVSARRRKKP